VSYLRRWYYYLEGKLQMPFKAKCKSRRSTSPLKVGETVDVIRMAEEDECMREVFAVLKLGKTKLAVPQACRDMMQEAKLLLSLFNHHDGGE